MKNLKVFLLAMFLVLSITGISGAVQTMVYDGVGGTWSDVNKTNVSGNPDAYLCWAAAGSNALAWAGWRGWNPNTSTYIDTTAGIYAKFVAGWPNTTGSATYAYEWWMTSRTESNIRQDPNNPNSPTTKVFPSAGLNFYPTVHVQDGDPASVTAFVKNTAANPPADGWIYQYLDTYIGDHRAIVASIDVPDPDGPGPLQAYSHSVTVWGWDPDPAVMDIYITDSDDGNQANPLRTYKFYVSGGETYIDNYTNLYTNSIDVNITQLTRLNRNVDGIEPNKPTGPGGEVPEPCTMILIGSGLLGLAGLRKRFKK